MSKPSRYLSVAIGLALSVVSAAAAADSKLGDAFNSMTSSGYTSTQAAQRYNGTVRSGVDFGSGRIATGGGVSNVRLVNFTPPQITVGCGGIDWHLGGISWINWDQFQDMLDGVLLAAQYAVVNMALDWISEKLGATFKAVMAALQNATRMELDSCKVGKELVQNLANTFIPQTDKAQSACESRVVVTNEASSLGDAGQACNSMAKTIEEWGQRNQISKAVAGWFGLTNADGSIIEKPDDDQHEDAPGGCPAGNCTWWTLTATGLKVKTPSNLPSATSTDPSMQEFLASIAHSELIMSGIGYYFLTDDGAHSGDEDSWRSLYKAQTRYAPTLSADQYVAVLMCGTNYLTASDDSALVTDASSAGDASGNDMVKEEMIIRTKAMYRTHCESLRKVVGGAVESQQVKIITCMPSSMASGASTAEGDLTAQLNSSALSGLVGLDGNELLMAKTSCTWPVAIPIRQWAQQPYVASSLLGEGLLARNSRVMQSIFAKLIRGGVALDPVTEVPFVLNSPAPVYQMLSLAALFPSQGVQMVDNETQLISILQTQAFIDKLISDAAKNADQKSGVDVAEYERTLAFFGNVAGAFGNVNLDVDKQTQRMAAFQAQVKVLQSAVMDSIYGKGLMGNLGFSADLAKGGG